MGDPLPEAGERHFAQELRSVNLAGSFQLSEWKEKQQKQSLSYGQISTKSLKEQRESLPVYKVIHHRRFGIARVHFAAIEDDIEHEEDKRI